MSLPKVGYSYWGFLGDVKMNSNCDIISTPDGNAFYSWSIIYNLLCREYDVVQVMPDRDAPAYSVYGKKLFDSWCNKLRDYAYTRMDKTMYNSYDLLLRFDKEHDTLSKDYVFAIFDNAKLYDCEFILHEYRMLIKGRNDYDTMLSKGSSWQPDYFLQDCLFEYCTKNNIKLIIFDLDYKITDERIKLIDSSDNMYIIELGDKYKDFSKATHVYIPFDFYNGIWEFRVNGKNTDVINRKYNNLVYIGNRYERDWCIDKYIPTEIEGVKIYGNWTESGRDSAERWPNIEFMYRLQTSEMRKVYSNSLATVLLAKKEYCEHHFMTARLIEAIFYGTVPLFIEEYGKDTIEFFAGRYADLLTVSSKADIIDRTYYFKYNMQERRKIIHYLRRHLATFMDVDNFVNVLLSI